MKTKPQVLSNIDKLRGDVKNLNVLISRGGSYDDLFQAFKRIDERIDNIEGLVDLEQDSFKNNQII